MVLRLSLTNKKHARVLDMTDQHSVLLFDAIEEFPLGAQVELRNDQEALLRFSVEEVELASLEERLCFIVGTAPGH